MEVANFWAAMDTLIGQDGLGCEWCFIDHSVSIKEMAKRDIHKRKEELWRLFL